MDDAAAPDALRKLVREVLLDVLPGRAAQNGRPPPLPPPAALAEPSGHPTPPAVPPTPPTSDPVPSRLPETSGVAGMTGPAGVTGDRETAPGSGITVWPVRLATDEDLHGFVLQVLRLADNP